jgi:hypothetical protein
MRDARAVPMRPASLEAEGEKHPPEFGNLWAQFRIRRGIFDAPNRAAKDSNRFSPAIRRRGYICRSTKTHRRRDGIQQTT